MGEKWSERLAGHEMTSVTADDVYLMLLDDNEALDGNKNKLMEIATLLADLVNKTDNQTLDGEITFSEPIDVPGATDDGHAVNKGQADGLYAVKEQSRAASLSVFDLASEEAIATGDTKARLPIPKALAGWDLTKVEGVCDSCTTKIEVQINNGTNDMLSTKLSIDSGDTHSKDATTAAVINTSYNTMAEGMILDVDVDGGAGEGLAIMFTFTGDMD